MRTEISATEAVRNFSELLNNIKYRGDRYTVMRGGKPAASIVPAEAATPERLLSELKVIFNTLPGLDNDDLFFERDVYDGVKVQPRVPEEAAWE